LVALPRPSEDVIRTIRAALESMKQEGFMFNDDRLDNEAAFDWIEAIEAVL